MKKIAILLFAVTLLTSCEADNATVLKEQFLVSKIRDYNNNVVAVYEYNDNEQLQKRITTDPINQRSSDYEFVYLNNRVSEIKYIDYTFPQFSHSKFLFYDSTAKIVRQETRQQGTVIGTHDCALNANGQVSGLIAIDGEQPVTYVYDAQLNVVQTKITFPDNGDTAIANTFI